MAIKFISEAEKRGQLAAKKYGAMTYSEILSRIIIWLLVGYMVIIFTCIGLYLSPIPDRMLSAILLVFVLVEMATEYALWMFTYQGMKKTEGPLGDLQQFSTITKEGWRRAEMVLDWTSPVFTWIDGLVKRSGMDWRNKDKTEVSTVVSNPNVEVVPPPPPPTTKELTDAIQMFTRAMQEVSEKLDKLSQQQTKKE